MMSQPTIGLIECFHVPFHGGACDQISNVAAMSQTVNCYVYVTVRNPDV